MFVQLETDCDEQERKGYQIWQALSNDTDLRQSNLFPSYTEE